METKDREVMTELLLYGITKEKVGQRVFRDLVDCITDDLDKLEPVIDRLVAESYARGRQFEKSTAIREDHRPHK